MKLPSEILSIEFGHGLLSEPRVLQVPQGVGARPFNRRKNS